MAESRETKTEQPHHARNMDLLLKAGTGMDLTIRDDQFEFSWLLDAVRICRKKRGRFRLIDSGKMESHQLEWLLEAGADFFTSSRIQRDAEELGRLSLACRRGKAFVASFQEGEIQSHEAEAGFVDPVKLGKYGIMIHISDKETERDLSQLTEIARSCREGRAALITYHHKRLGNGLEALTDSGSWIHMFADKIGAKEDVVAVIDLTASARANGSGVIVHGTGELDQAAIEDLIAAGVVLLPKTRCFDYKSPFKFLEKVISKTRLPTTAYYLYPDIML